MQKSMEKTVKTHLKRYCQVGAHLGGHLGSLGDVSGPHLGPPGGQLGLRLAILEPSWAMLSRLGATLERCWRNLGPHRMISGKNPPSGTVSGPIWNGLGTVSGIFWKPFWSKIGPKMDRKPSGNQSIRHLPANTHLSQFSMIWGPSVSAQRSKSAGPQSGWPSSE